MLSVWRPLGDLFRDDTWNREWDEVFGRTRAASFAPAVDVLDRPEAFVLKAELPGVKPEEVDLQVHDNVLTLRGERNLEQKSDRDGYHRVERRYGAFNRSFALPDGVDGASISATLEQGILTVTIPKAAREQPRKIAVKAAAGLVDKAKTFFKSAESGTSAQVSEQTS